MIGRVSSVRIGIIVSALLLLGASPVDVDKKIAQVAVAYAQGFEFLLRSEPTEAERFGLAADDLADLKVASVHQLRSVDARFRMSDDARDLGQALVPMDLWWVVLSVDSSPRLVVSVQWPEGAAEPQAVGLNWVPASRLARALEQVDSRGPTVVYLPDDVSLVLGEVEGVAMVMPIADEVLSAWLELPLEPVPVVEYTRALRVRLDRLARQAEDAVPGLGSGGVGKSSSGSTQVGLLLVALLGPLVLLTITAVAPSRDRRRRGARR